MSLLRAFQASLVGGPVGGYFAGNALLAASEPLDLSAYNQLTVETLVRPQQLAQGGVRYNNLGQQLGNGGAVWALLFAEYGTALWFIATTTAGVMLLQVPITAADYQDRYVHLAATYDGTTAKLWRTFEGEPTTLLGATPGSGQLAASTDNYAICGGYNGGDFQTFTGFMVEHRTWSVARTQGQIAASAFRRIPTPAAQPDLRACYSFKGVRGKTLIADSSARASTAEFALTGRLMPLPNHRNPILS